MVKSSVTSITPATHADRHSVGGADPLVNPLLLHAARHAAGGADELSGLLTTNDTVFLDGGTVNNVWTNIDLSAEIGVNQALVILEVLNLSANPSHFGFRPDGSGNEHYNVAGGMYGANKCDLATNAGMTNSAFVIVTTDASGVIEYKCNGQNTRITLVAYAILA